MRKRHGLQRCVPHRAAGLPRGGRTGHLLHFLDHPDTNFSPLGARGIGELGTVGTAAAIGNAVFDATGRRVRDLPITVDKLI
ncbi:hypothetical protein ABZ372_33655 [Streptomyces sp. NPDC005921]